MQSIRSRVRLASTAYIMFLRWFPAGLGSVPGAEFVYLVDQHNTMAMAIHEVADERFTRSICVDVSRVDEISTGIAESIVHFQRLVLCGTPPPIIAERHGAERRL